MSNETSESGGGPTPGERETSEFVEAMTRTLDQWKARIDELKV
jgi:hypothetical protein